MNTDTDTLYGNSKWFWNIKGTGKIIYSDNGEEINEKEYTDEVDISNLKINKKCYIKIGSVSSSSVTIIRPYNYGTQYGRKSSDESKYSGIYNYKIIYNLAELNELENNLMMTSFSSAYYSNYEIPAAVSYLSGTEGSDVAFNFDISSSAISTPANTKISVTFTSNQSCSISLSIKGTNYKTSVTKVEANTETTLSLATSKEVAGSFTLIVENGITSGYTLNVSSISVKKLPERITLTGDTWKYPKASPVMWVPGFGNINVDESTNTKFAANRTQTYDFSGDKRAFLLTTTDGVTTLKCYYRQLGTSTVVDNIYNTTDDGTTNMHSSATLSGLNYTFVNGSSMPVFGDIDVMKNWLKSSSTLVTGALNIEDQT